MNKLADVGHGTKGILMVREVAMGRFIQKCRYTNPYQKFIQTHIDWSTSLVKDGVCYLIIDLYAPFRGVMLWVMSISIHGGDVVLPDYL